MNKYHALAVSYHGPTDKNPGRIKIKSLLFTPQYIWVKPDGDRIWETAATHLESLGFTINGMAEAFGREFILLSETFKPLKNDF